MDVFFSGEIISRSSWSLALVHKYIPVNGEANISLSPRPLRWPANHTVADASGAAYEGIEKTLKWLSMLVKPFLADMVQQMDLERTNSDIKLKVYAINRYLKSVRPFCECERAFTLSKFTSIKKRHSPNSYLNFPSLIESSQKFKPLPLFTVMRMRVNEQLSHTRTPWDLPPCTQVYSYGQKIKVTRFSYLKVGCFRSVEKTFRQLKRNWFRYFGRSVGGQWVCHIEVYSAPMPGSKVFPVKASMLQYVRISTA